jgi:hypothetical protein
MRDTLSLLLPGGYTHAECKPTKMTVPEAKVCTHGTNPTQTIIGVPNFKAKTPGLWNKCSKPGKKNLYNKTQSQLEQLSILHGREIQAL